MSTAPFNLLHERWLPARRQSGPCQIRPSEIADRSDDPVLAIEWPRADFRVASLEFLIGLLQTAAPAADEASWRARWHDPPHVEELDAAFAPFAPAFNLDGDGPRFLQDTEKLPGDSLSPAGLLIDAPGENAQKNNTDLLVKRGGASRLSRSAAAMALYTLQAFSPAGGSGHRTGLRGGGPLTTLVVPGRKGLGSGTAGTDHFAPLPLWYLLWVHVGLGEPVTPAEMLHVFPWLGPTRTSEAGKPPLVPSLAHPVHVFWSMPRRIRLDFAANPDALACDLTGLHDTVVVDGWRARPFGIQYSAWMHPLTPYYRQRPTDQPLPVHPQPGGVGYRHWVGLVVSDGKTRLAAEAVRRIREHRWRLVGGPNPRLFAAGYDMDNAKARGFVESEMPLISLADDEARHVLDDAAERLVRGAAHVADLLRGAVRDALFNASNRPAPDTTVLEMVRATFWAETESTFFRLLDHIARQVEADPSTNIDPAMTEWLSELRRVALATFDVAAPLDPDAWRVRNADRLDQAQPLVAARRRLGRALAGYGKLGNELFAALALVAPENGANRRKGKR